MCCGRNTRSFSNYRRSAPKNFSFNMNYAIRGNIFFYNRRGR